MIQRSKKSLIPVSYKSYAFQKEHDEWNVITGQSIEKLLTRFRAFHSYRQEFHFRTINQEKLIPDNP